MGLYISSTREKEKHVYVGRLRGRRRKGVHNLGGRETWKREGQTTHLSAHAEGTVHHRGKSVKNLLARLGGEKGGATTT